MSQSKQLKFTKTTLTGLENDPGENWYFVYDALVQEFCLVVTRTGHKSFYLNRNIYGRSLRINIGPFPDIPI